MSLGQNPCSAFLACLATNENAPSFWCKIRWTTVVAYAAAMASVEGAVVVYLRTLIENSPEAHALPVVGGFGKVEPVRELATMIMLLAVGALAGRTWRSRIAFMFIAFGVWDILYYVFLAGTIGWPQSLNDRDLLFLVPLPWWGPVWAPVSISLLMIAGGTMVSRFDQPGHPVWPGARAWKLSIVGAFLALYVFMADGLASWIGNPRLPREPLAGGFNWPLFLLALLLMAAPVADVCWQSRRRLHFRFGLTLPESSGEC